VRLSRTALKTVRDIRRSRWQFLAVCVATALGVAIFIGSYGSFQNLRSSYARTYDRLSMADLWFEVGDAPASVAGDVRALPGVESAEGRLVSELPVTFPRLDSPHILARLVSLPEGGERPSVNDVAVVDGRYVQDSSEVLLEQSFAKFNHVELGDTMQVTVSDGSQLELTVAGFVVSPEYLFPARNEQEMFSPPSQFGIVFLPYSKLSSFLNREDRVNDVAIRLAGGADAAVVAQQVSDALSLYGLGRVTDREHQLSNRLLQLDLDGFRGLALVFPLLFLLVGGLAAYTLLNRLMQSQRGQIGVMRAMGYSRASILRHYAGFGVAIGLAGASLGAVGGWLLADLVTRGYATSLNVPFVVVSPNLQLLAIGFAAGLAITIVSSLLPAWSAAKIAPAEAMRPPAPPRGFHTPLERLLPGMRRLPYALKLPLRNVFRVPRRSLFTALGVGAGVSLVLVGASLLDSFNNAVDLQFKSIENYDARVDFSEPFALTRLQEVASVAGVQAAEAIAEVPVQLSAGSAQSNVLLQAVQPDAELLRVYTPDNARVRPGSGLLIPETLAKSLGLHVGDNVSVQALTGSQGAVNLRVDGITTQPLGSVVVTELNTAAGLLGNGEAGTAVLVKIAGRDTAAVQRDLYGIEGVTTVLLKQDVQDYIGQFSALFIVFVTIMLAFGVALGFAIIFNAITISAIERQRELATMRVIGTSLGRLVQVLTIENAIIGVCGVVLGIPVGLVIAHYFASLYQNDLIDMPLVIYTRTYALAATGALLTVALAEVPAVRFVKHLNLPEVTREMTT